MHACMLWACVSAACTAKGDWLLDHILSVCSAVYTQSGSLKGDLNTQVTLSQIEFGCSA